MVSRLNGVQEALSSNLNTRTRNLYLERGTGFLFCPETWNSRPLAARSAGLIPALGTKALAPGSLEFESQHSDHVVASFISLATTFFIKKSSCAHTAAPPFQIEPAALGFDLVERLDLFLERGTGFFFSLQTKKRLSQKGKPLLLLLFTSCARCPLWRT